MKFSMSEIAFKSDLDLSRKIIPIQLIFVTDELWVGAIRESPLQDVSYSFIYLVLVYQHKLN